LGVAELETLNCMQENILPDLTGDWNWDTKEECGVLLNWQGSSCLQAAS
jgi:hypothetical protein